MFVNSSQKNLIFNFKKRGEIERTKKKKNLFDVFLSSSQKGNRIVELDPKLWTDACHHQNNCSALVWIERLAWL